MASNTPNGTQTPFQDISNTLSLGNYQSLITPIVAQVLNCVVYLCRS
jgi:hypothetical protein